ncbi:MAG TPA: hypothetical protein VGX92_02615 [Pyrinomonadaceae bacterium]|jgi:hypothetical protein|nr:hypothetical protein [Pyrinomonadaceae bacterium]
MYKPNFCADCGTRIERLRWHLWSSRRFCAPCARRFRRTQILLPAIAAVSLFSLGLLAGRSMRPAPPPLVIERAELPLAPASAASKAGAESTDESGGQDDAAASEPEPVYGPSGTATERPTDPAEVVSICGARTQKGTPCRRRVRGTGRCWQHKGMPAITRNTVIN